MKNDEFEIRLRDLIIPHVIYLNRYTEGLQSRAIKALNSALQRLEGDLAKRLIKIEPRGLDVNRAATKRLSAQIDDVRKLIDGAYKKVNKQVLSELGELAQDEVDFTISAIKTVKQSVSKDATALNKARFEAASTKAKKAEADHDLASRQAKIMGRKPPKPPVTEQPKKPQPVRLEVEFPTRTPAPALVKAVAEDRPMSGRLLKAWTDKMSRETQDAVEQAIRDGVLSGKTTDQIVRDIIGTRAGRYRDGILQASRRSMEAFVRTSVTHIHNMAAQTGFAENDDVVSGWRFLATLDLRTTVTCAGLSGRKYPIGKGPIPPRHVRCRSICQPITLTMRELGIDVDEPGPSSRASMDGPLSGDIRYDEWLKGRSIDEQDDFLGTAKAKLFRAGKLKLEDLVDDTGRVFNLKELRAQHPNAFV